MTENVRENPYLGKDFASETASQRSVSLLSEASQSEQTFDNYLHTQPLTSYKPPKKFEYFKTGNNPSIQHIPAKKKKLNSIPRLLPPLLSPTGRSGGIPSEAHVPNFADDVATLEIEKKYIAEKSRYQIAQNISSFIRFYCASIKGHYSIADIEQLLESPPFISLDYSNDNNYVRGLITSLKAQFDSAKVTPIQFFDKITDFKHGFQQTMNYQEFCYGLNRFCDELSFPLWELEDIDNLFQYFLRSPNQPLIRRQDFKVGFKKLKLSVRRILWLNHKASLLRQCSRFLNRINLHFRDLSMSLVLNPSKAQLSQLDLDSALVVLISDYLIFKTAKNRDALISSFHAGKERNTKSSQSVVSELSGQSLGDFDQEDDTSTKLFLDNMSNCSLRTGSAERPEGLVRAKSSVGQRGLSQPSLKKLNSTLGPGSRVASEKKEVVDMPSGPPIRQRSSVFTKNYLVNKTNILLSASHLDCNVDPEKDDFYGRKKPRESPNHMILNMLEPGERIVYNNLMKSLETDPLTNGKPIHSQQSIDHHPNQSGSVVLKLRDTKRMDSIMRRQSLMRQYSSVREIIDEQDNASQKSGGKQSTTKGHPGNLTDFLEDEASIEPILQNDSELKNELKAFRSDMISLKKKSVSEYKGIKASFDYRIAGLHRKLTKNL